MRRLVPNNLAQNTNRKTIVTPVKRKKKGKMDDQLKRKRAKQFGTKYNLENEYHTKKLAQFRQENTCEKGKFDDQLTRKRTKQFGTKYNFKSEYHTKGLAQFRQGHV